MTHKYHILVAFAIIAATACDTGGTVSVTGTGGTGGSGGAPAMACQLKSGCHDGGTGGSIVLGTGGAK